MKQLWPLIGLLWICLTSAKAPGPQINDSTINKLKDVAESARIKYIQEKERNEVLPFANQYNKIKKAPVSAQLTISKIAKTLTGTTLTIVSNISVTDGTVVGLGVVTGNNDNFESVYETAATSSDFTSPEDVTFGFDISTLIENDLTLFAVTVRTEADVVLAAGSVSYHAKDITPSAVDRVGTNNDGDVAIRLAYPQNFIGEIIVNGDLCTCTAYPCYCVGLNKADTVTELCAKMTSLEDTMIEFMLCDSTLTPKDAFGSIVVNSASLTHNIPAEATLEIDCTYTVDSTTVEIVYYEAAAVKAAFTSVKCAMNQNLCTANIDGIQDTDISNRILVVTTLTDSSASGSQIQDFEDYKVKLYQLSDTTAEVSWTTIEPSDFTLTFDSVPTTTINECSAAICKAYLNSFDVNAKHMVSVYKTGENNAVGNELQFTAGAGVEQLTIDKLLKTVSDTDGKTTVEVTVTGNNILAIEDITLGLLVDVGGTITEYIYQTEGISEITVATLVQFTVETVALTGDSHTIIVATHDMGNLPTAAGETTVILKAFNTVMDIVGVAEQNEDLSSFRVTTAIKVTVDGTPCAAAADTYILGKNAPDSEPVEVCDNTITPSQFVCDVTIPVNPFQGTIAVENVTITLVNDTPTINILVAGVYNSLSTTMDIVVYEGDTENSIENCNINKDPPTQFCLAPFSRTGLSATFQLLMVALNDDRLVVESLAINFEDYKTTAQQLTTDLMEVRWQSTIDTVFQISLNKDVPDAYNQVTVTCGETNNDKCKAYFMMLAPEEYIARVKLNDITEFNIVAATEVMSISAGSEALFITSVDLKNQERTSLATVCFDHIGPLKSAKKTLYELTMIDRSGHILLSSSMKDSLCVDNLTIDSSFDTSVQVRILVSTVGNDTREVGDSDLYLLDPNTQDSIAYVSVKQVGQTTLKATWTNLNDASSYQISSNENQNVTEVCSLRQQCGMYIDFSETASSPVTVTIRENGDIVQTLSLTVEISTNIPPISISSISMRWDNRVQVCFIPPADEVLTYELGLVQEPNKLLESSMSLELVSGDNGTSCLVSEKTVEIGAFIALRSLISAFGSNGNLLASGSKVLKSIFLSASRSVYGAIMNDKFLTTWHLLDNIDETIEIKVTLLALDAQGTRVIATVNVTAAVTTHEFEMQPEGKYSICAVAFVQNEGITSEEICSDIIRIHNMTVEAPIVETTSPKTTSQDAVLVTWEPPIEEDVTGFFISWNKNPVISSVPQTSRTVHIPKIRDTVIHPLDLVNSVKESSKASVTGFTIVGSSETSFEVQGLESGKKYSTCVSSVKDDVVGAGNCNDVDLSGYEALEIPTNLIYENGNLRWTGDESKMHRVECHSRTDKKESLYRDINGTSGQLDLIPGEWDLEVRSYTESSFSEATRITQTVEGLVISARQREQTSLVVAWYELNSAASGVAENLYEIVLKRNDVPLAGPIPIYCSGLFDDKCQYEFQNLAVSATDTVKVIVDLKTTTKAINEYDFTFRNITGITMITKTVRSSDEVDVAWEEVPQAKKYLYTIYDSEFHNNTIEQDYIPGTSLTLTMPNVTGYWLTVQGCTDDEHCGNLAEILLSQGSGNNTDNKTTIIIAATVSSIVGVGLILVIVAVRMRKKGRRGGKRGSRREGQEPIYDKWGARTLGQPRPPPEELPKSPSSRRNYGIPSSFNVHS